MAGEAEPLDIEDDIDAWHMRDATVDIFSWLGVTREEYALYVRDVAVFEREMTRKREASR